MKLFRILTGLKNWAFSSPEVEQIALQRIQHCERCEHAVPSALFLGEFSCSLCGCLLEAKIRSPKEKCPAGKWSESSTKAEVKDCGCNKSI